MKKNWYRKKICGLYRLWDKTTGKSYVGKSKDIFSRWAEHAGGVSSDVSREFSKRPTDFCWEVLETCDEAQLGAREMFWIILYAEQPAGVYNRLVPRSPGARKMALARATASYEAPETVTAAAENKRRDRVARKAARAEAAAYAEPLLEALQSLKQDKTYVTMAEDEKPLSATPVPPPTLEELDALLAEL
jgi:hypothetical protein